MKEMRLMGNLVQKLSDDAKLDINFMCQHLDCTENQYHSFLSGRLFLSVNQLEKLASLFNITVDKLMDGDEECYERNIVHCMGEFEDSNNREKILDIIDDYLTLLSATK